MIAIIYTFFLSCYSMTNIDYAHMYANQLMLEYDNNLEVLYLSDVKKSLTSTNVYKKLQNARSFIEHHDEDAIPKFISPLFDQQEFLKVKSVIDNELPQYSVISDVMKDLNDLIYPSVNAAGNISGNTFPSGVWSLTFDDGPKNKNTQAIVDYLIDKNIKATFFMLAKMVKKFKKAARYVIDNDMEIALHSYTHPDFRKITEVDMKKEISEAKFLIERELNVDIKFFRLPYGAGLRNSLIRKNIAADNLIHTFWNIDTLDWKDKDPRSVLNRVIKTMKVTPNNSGIILFHDIHSASVKSSELIVDYVLSLNHKFCTLEEIVNYLNKSSSTCIY